MYELTYEDFLGIMVFTLGCYCFYLHKEIKDIKKYFIQEKQKDLEDEEPEED